LHPEAAALDDAPAPVEGAAGVPLAAALLGAVDAPPLHAVTAMAAIDTIAAAFLNDIVELLQIGMR